MFIILFIQKTQQSKGQSKDLLHLCSYELNHMFFCLLFPTGASAEEEDELYERGVVESNCVYRLVENRLVPHEQAWASIPSISLLGSTEV